MSAPCAASGVTRELFGDHPARMFLTRWIELVDHRGEPASNPIRTGISAAEPQIVRRRAEQHAARCGQRQPVRGDDRGGLLDARAPPALFCA